MDAKFAVIKRTKELLAERKINITDLNSRGVSPEVVNAIYQEEPIDIAIEDLNRLCNALRIDLPDFMNSELFRK